MSRPMPKAERWEQVRKRLAPPDAGGGYQGARRALELGEQIHRHDQRERKARRCYTGRPPS